MERQPDPRQVNDIRGAKELNDFVLKTGLCLRHKTERMRYRAQRSNVTHQQTGSLSHSLAVSCSISLSRSRNQSLIFYFPLCRSQPPSSPCPNNAKITQLIHLPNWGESRLAVRLDFCFHLLCLHIFKWLYVTFVNVYILVFSKRIVSHIQPLLNSRALQQQTRYVLILKIHSHSVQNYFRHCKENVKFFKYISPQE